MQVHTPYSELNNGFGTDFDAYARELLTRAIREGIAAIAVTDYFSIEGYRQLRSLVDDRDRLIELLGLDAAQLAGRLLLLPNVELRTSTIVRNTDGSDSRVNFHVIFSDDLDPLVIEEDFLRELRFTAESNPDSPDDRWSLTPRNLQLLGERLKREHEPFRDRSDLYIGLMNAVVHHDEVTQVLDRQESKFKDRYLVVVPADEDLSACSWNGQGHLERKLLIQKSHMLFSANSGTREFGLGRRHPSAQAFVDEFKTLKPCIHGSDAHSVAELFRPALGRQLWIKADPTFNGLRQVLHEPEERVYIGPEPPSIARIAARPTRVVESVRIGKAPGSSLDEQWFDTSLDLNSELVAIIGNKGNGKSALTDVLGLLGNTPNFKSMSFLCERRFRDPKSNKAHHFEAMLVWADGSSVGPTLLDSNPDPAAPETILYIPQGYLDEVCNEVELGSGSRFYGELQRVIFSHIPSADRQGCSTLEELLGHRGAEVQKIIGTLVSELHRINVDIVGLEAELAPQHRRKLELALVEKRRELEAHELQRPKEVPVPDEDPATQVVAVQVAAALEKSQLELGVLEASISEMRGRDALLARKAGTAERLMDGLRNLRHQYETFSSDAKLALAELGLDPTAVVSLTIDDAPVRLVMEAVGVERASVASQLDVNVAGSLEARHSETAEAIRVQQEALSAPQRAYQEYLSRLRDWQVGADQINGAGDLPGSIKYLESQLLRVDSMPTALAGRRRERDGKALEILREKLRLRAYFQSYYEPVHSYVAAHPLALSGHLTMTFEVALSQAGLVDALLGAINQRKMGSFAGLVDGTAAARELVASVDWDSLLGPIRFTRRAIEKLQTTGDRPRDIQEQLKSGVSTLQLYDLLFSFQYLDPIYRLTWNGRGLEQLSPGERGNLLLVFYLLLDKGDIPLVLDQPEENLDNQSVVRTLVPCMKEAKKRRQVFMVTHNPNLAVVCDADQVIWAEIDREHGNSVTYVSGSIENPLINRKIVDVLEGTRPAFDMRDAKYLPYRVQ